MIFEAEDLEYDISKDSSFRCNSYAYSAPSGQGLGLEIASRISETNQTNETNHAESASHSSHNKHTKHTTSPAKKSTLKTPPPVSFNTPSPLTRKRSVSFGSDHVQSFDKAAPPDRVISNSNVGSKMAYTSTTVVTLPTHATPVSARELCTRLNTIYI
ncbi:hypothetical protein E3P96_02088 [Wallemia ichthyophaga]|nr:hypothetical protein E3P96_02088 [Wallemia ichthyophaga]